MSTRRPAVPIAAIQNGFGRRFRKLITDRATLMTLPVIGVFCLLRPLGLIAAIPYWAIVALLLGVAVINTAVVALYAESEERWKVRVRMGVETGVIALVIYTVGWGPLLAIGFVFGAADFMQTKGSAVAREAIVLSVVAIAIGQLAIYLHIAPTLIRQPLVHGLGVLAALGTVITIKVLQWFAVAREASEARFRALVQNASDIVVVVDDSGQFSWVSPSFTRNLGWSVTDFEGRPARDLLHPEDGERLLSLATSTSPPELAEFSSEIRLRHADGSWRWFEATVTNHLDDANVQGIVANLHDVTDRRTLEDELRHQAFHDSLTGLANRALFLDRLEHALAQQMRDPGELAVLLVDLDDFKAVNDILGHGTGDRILTEAALRLLAAVRSSDTVARLGGDEFAVLLERPAEDQGADHVAERIVQAFSEPFVLEGQRLVVTTSVGVARSTPETMTADELLLDADVAMYAAKASGKGRSSGFTPDLRLTVQRRMELKRDLPEAIAAGDQMQLCFQPVIDMASRLPVGVEALLRWRHPQHGLLAPSEFLPLAEETASIVPLGRWVLREAIATLSAWSLSDDALSRLWMSVNVSGRQLDDSQFVGDVGQALAEWGIEPELLVLEITESAFLHEDEEVTLRLQDLKHLGTKLAIDDFGAGYSSFGYLRRVPVDILKIDQSFVADLMTNGRKATLAETVVRMGEALGLEAIAEGVESEATTEALLALGCQLGQGFLFAEPLPAPACVAFLREASARSASHVAHI